VPPILRRHQGPIENLKFNFKFLTFVFFDVRKAKQKKKKKKRTMQSPARVSIRLDTIPKPHPSTHSINRTSAHSPPRRLAASFDQLANSDQLASFDQLGNSDQRRLANSDHRRLTSSFPGTPSLAEQLEQRGRQLGRVVEPMAGAPRARQGLGLYQASAGSHPAAHPAAHTAAAHTTASTAATSARSVFSGSAQRSGLKGAATGKRPATAPAGRRQAGQARAKVDTGRAGTPQASSEQAAGRAGAVVVSPGRRAELEAQLAAKERECARLLSLMDTLRGDGHAVGVEERAALQAAQDLLELRSADLNQATQAKNSLIASRDSARGGLQANLAMIAEQQAAIEGKMHQHHGHAAGAAAAAAAAPVSRLRALHKEVAMLMARAEEKRAALESRRAELHALQASESRKVESVRASLALRVPQGKQAQAAAEGSLAQARLALEETRAHLEDVGAQVSRAEAELKDARAERDRVAAEVVVLEARALSPRKAAAQAGSPNRLSLLQQYDRAREELAHLSEEISSLEAEQAAVAAEDEDLSAAFASALAAHRAAASDLQAAIGEAGAREADDQAVARRTRDEASRTTDEDARERQLFEAEERVAEEQLEVVRGERDKLIAEWYEQYSTDTRVLRQVHASCSAQAEAMIRHGADASNLARVLASAASAEAAVAEASAALTALRDPVPAVELALGVRRDALSAFKTCLNATVDALDPAFIRSCYQAMNEEAAAIEAAGRDLESLRGSWRSLAVTTGLGSQGPQGGALEPVTPSRSRTLDPLLANGGASELADTLSKRIRQVRASENTLLQEAVQLDRLRQRLLERTRERRDRVSAVSAWIEDSRAATRRRRQAEDARRAALAAEQEDGLRQAQAREEAAVAAAETAERLRAQLARARGDWAAREAEEADRSRTFADYLASARERLSGLHAERALREDAMAALSDMMERERGRARDTLRGKRDQIVHLNAEEHRLGGLIEDLRRREGAVASQCDELREEIRAQVVAMQAEQAQGERETVELERRAQAALAEWEAKERDLSAQVADLEAGLEAVQAMHARKQAEVSALLATEAGRDAERRLGDEASASHLSEAEKAAWRICVQNAVQLDAELRDVEDRLRAADEEYERALQLFLKDQAEFARLQQRFVDRRVAVTQELQELEGRYAAAEAACYDLHEAITAGASQASALKAIPAVRDPALRTVLQQVAARPDTAALLLDTLDSADDDRLGDESLRSALATVQRRHHHHHHHLQTPASITAHQLLRPQLPATSPLFRTMSPPSSAAAPVRSVSLLTPRATSTPMASRATPVTPLELKLDERLLTLFQRLAPLVSGGTLWKLTHPAKGTASTPAERVFSLSADLQRLSYRVPGAKIAEAFLRTDKLAEVIPHRPGSELLHEVAGYPFALRVNDSPLEDLLATTEQEYEVWTTGLKTLIQTRTIPQTELNTLIRHLKRVTREF
jgi:hypothetical protein